DGVGPITGRVRRGDGGGNRTGVSAAVLISSGRDDGGGRKDNGTPCPVNISDSLWHRGVIGNLGGLCRAKGPSFAGLIALSPRGRSCQSVARRATLITLKSLALSPPAASEKDLVAMTPRFVLAALIATCWPAGAAPEARGAVVVVANRTRAEIRFTLT